jgi:hypothetical protein
LFSALNKDEELTEREKRLTIFALGRLDNLMGLIGVRSMSLENFSRDETRKLAQKLGAKID